MKKVTVYDLADCLRMLKGEREAAKECGDKEAMKLLDGIIRKFKTAK